MEYPKIETLFKRDEKTHKVHPDKLRNPLYGIIKTWQFTEKIDGTNIRVMWTDGKLRIGGRTDKASLPADLVQLLYETIDAQKMRETFGDNPAIIYGEGYGAGIQKGSGYSRTKQLVVFDVLVDGKWWLNRQNVYGIATKLGLKTVPFMGEMDLDEAVTVVRGGLISLLAQRQGQTSETIPAEGLVGRTVEPLFDKHGNRLIIKLKTKDF